MAKEGSLFDKACGTLLHSRFVARADDLNRDMTDEEVIEEAKYQLEDLPYKGWDDDKLVALAMRQMRALIKNRRDHNVE